VGNEGTILKTSRGGLVSVREMLQEKLPTTFDLLPNYPNPFNPTTTIQYSNPARGKIVLEIFNVLGQKVASLVNDEQEAGSHSIVWNGRTDHGSAVASGVYFYRLVAGKNVQTRAMVLLK
jgi:hypothetical protein